MTELSSAHDFYPQAPFSGVLVCYCEAMRESLTPRSSREEEPANNEQLPDFEQRRGEWLSQKGAEIWQKYGKKTAVGLGAGVAIVGFGAAEVGAVFGLAAGSEHVAAKLHEFEAANPEWKETITAVGQAVGGLALGGLIVAFLKSNARGRMRE